MDPSTTQQAPLQSHNVTWSDPGPLRGYRRRCRELNLPRGLPRRASSTGRVPSIDDDEEEEEGFSLSQSDSDVSEQSEADLRDPDAVLMRLALQEPTLRQWLSTGLEDDSVAGAEWLEDHFVDEKLAKGLYHRLYNLRKDYGDIIDALSPAARASFTPSAWSADDAIVLFRRSNSYEWFSVYHEAMCNNSAESAEVASSTASGVQDDEKHASLPSDSEPDTSASVTDAPPWHSTPPKSGHFHQADASLSKMQPSHSTPKSEVRRQRQAALSAARNAAESSFRRQANVSPSPARRLPSHLLQDRRWTNRNSMSAIGSSSSASEESQHLEDRSSPLAEESYVDTEQRPETFGEVRVGRIRELIEQQLYDKTGDEVREAEVWKAMRRMARESCDAEQSAERPTWEARNTSFVAVEEQGPRQDDQGLSTEELLLEFQDQLSLMQRARFAKLDRRQEARVAFEQRARPRLDTTGRITAEELIRLQGIRAEHADRARIEEMMLQEDEWALQEQAQLEQKIGFLERLLGWTQAQ